MKDSIFCLCGYTHFLVLYVQFYAPPPLMLDAKINLRHSLINLVKFKLMAFKINCMNKISILLQSFLPSIPFNHIQVRLKLHTVTQACYSIKIHSPATVSGTPCHLLLYRFSAFYRGEIIFDNSKILYCPPIEL